MAFINSCLVEAVTVNGLLLVTVEKSGIRKLIEPMVNALPPNSRKAVNRASITECITEKANKFRKELSEKFKNNLIPLKIDCGARKTRTFLGITTQLISTQPKSPWKIQTYTLACKELSGSHSGEKLKEVIGEVLGQYGVTMEQVITVPTISIDIEHLS